METLRGRKYIGKPCARQLPRTIMTGSRSTTQNRSSMPNLYHTIPEDAVCVGERQQVEPRQVAAPLDGIENPLPIRHKRRRRCDARPSGQWNDLPTPQQQTVQQPVCCATRDFDVIGLSEARYRLINFVKQAQMSNANSCNHPALEFILIFRTRDPTVLL